jgi:hypothetical protein
MRDADAEIDEERFRDALGLLLLLDGEDGPATAPCTKSASCESLVIDNGAGCCVGEGSSETLSFF